ncbi:MAG: arylsulfotransferase family protein [Pseudomonadota bacterium]
MPNSSIRDMVKRVQSFVEKERKLTLLHLVPVFVLVAGAFSFWGRMSSELGVFPNAVIEFGEKGFEEVLEITGVKKKWFIVAAPDAVPATIHDAAAIAPGLTLVSGIGPKETPTASVVDQSGEVVHSWRLSWYDLWPNPEHVPFAERPKTWPGTHVHGILFDEETGGIVFNFERLGLIKVDICGDPVWRAPHRTHHSLFRDDDGYFWAPGLVMQEKLKGDPEGYGPPFKDFFIWRFSPEGELIDERRLFDVMLDHGLEGQLFMTKQANSLGVTIGDTLHFNDMEVFPQDMEPGVFEPGDVMLSLRNINAVLVFNSDFSVLKHYFHGPFVRQHDPDFIDGDTISVFDNYSHTVSGPNPRSRIVRLNARTGDVEIEFEGSADAPFFTDVMGKHQRLPNGNILLVESANGRLLEVDADGRPVWEFRNIIREGYVALVDNGERLDPRFDRAYFERQRSRCGGDA